MGLKCNISLKTSSIIIALIEIIAGGTIGVLCALNWKILSETQPVVFFYHPQNGEPQNVVNSKITASVTYWILSLVGFMALFHLLLASTLLHAVRKKSENSGKAWIALKGLGIIFATFFAIAAMTTDGWYTKITTLLDLSFHLITAFYIKIMYSSLSTFDTVLISNKIEEF